LACLCDMADQAGCSIYELVSSMSSTELNLRVTNRLIQKGYTFDQQKISEIKQREKDAEVEAVLKRAREYWKKS